MEHGVIEVTASHSPFAFIYSLFKANIEIDGTLEKRSWGTHPFEVAPGTHKVEVSYWWLFNNRCGKNSVEVTLAAGQTIRVRYEAGLVRYVPGTITVEGPLPTARIV